MIKSNSRKNRFEILQRIKNPRGGGKFHQPPPCTTVEVWLCGYVRGLNNLSYTGIKVSRLAFIISCLISSENGDLLFFNLTVASRISFSVMAKSSGRKRWPWRSFSCSSLQIFCRAGLRGSFEWRVWKYCSQFYVTPSRAGSDENKFERKRGIEPVYTISKTWMRDC